MHTGLVHRRGMYTTDTSHTVSDWLWVWYQLAHSDNLDS